MKSAVFSILSSPLRAESVVNDLRLAGFAEDDISVLFPDKTGQRVLAHAKSSRAPEGAVVGTSVGGMTGGLVGWLIGLGSLVVPGAGSLIAAGPVLAALSGLAVGGTAGGLSGAMVGLGFPEYEARLYAGKLQAGNILVAAHTEDRDQIKVVREIFERAEAHDIGVTHEAAVEI